MAQLVEQRIRNAWVTSSSLVIGSSGNKKDSQKVRSLLLTFYFFQENNLDAAIAQLVEQRLPKPQVTSSNLACRS